jgi:long-chain acyl-CoA synthetase
VAKARATRAAMTAKVPGTLSWDRAGRPPAPLAPTILARRPTTSPLLQYTGGTTGVPKGAMLTHRNLRSNAAQGRAWVPGLVDGEEVVYAVLPLFHAYGLTLCLTFTMSIGATLVLFPRFDVDHTLEAMAPPRHLPARRPADVPGACRGGPRAGVDLSSIRYAISGAMSLPTTSSTTGRPSPAACSSRATA